jgi:folate-binding protein YgfZ
LQPIDAEYRALTEAAGLLDLNDRGRLCLLGADREKFLHGQVTNEVLRLEPGRGCYAALVSAKGRVETDLFVFKLTDEILLDFEPGLAGKVTERLEKFIIAEDVQIVDVSTLYGLLSLQGPRAETVLAATEWVTDIPNEPLRWTKAVLPEGDLYIARNDRFGLPAYDLFVPAGALDEVAAKCLRGGAVWVGTEAREMARIENGIPRFGVDMDETNLAPETGIQNRAISYAKGCYIGQEVIARIRTYGQVAKALRLLRLAPGGDLPEKGVKLMREGKEVGYITSSTHSPRHGARVALAYVRKEANAVGTDLTLFGSGTVATIIAVPGGG